MVLESNMILVVWWDERTFRHAAHPNVGHVVQVEKAQEVESLLCAVVFGESWRFDKSPDSVDDLTIAALKRCRGRRCGKRDDYYHMTGHSGFDCKHGNKTTQREWKDRSGWFGVSVVCHTAKQEAKRCSR